MCVCVVDVDEVATKEMLYSLIPAALEIVSTHSRRKLKNRRTGRQTEQFCRKPRQTRKAAGNCTYVVASMYVCQHGRKVARVYMHAYRQTDRQTDK